MARRDIEYTHDHEAGRIVLAALAGAAIGAGVALLFAPKSGVDLRGEIGGSVESLQDAVSKRYRDLAERASSAIEHVNDTAARAVTAMEEGAKQFARATESKVRAQGPVSAGE